MNGGFYGPGVFSSRYWVFPYLAWWHYTCGAADYVQGTIVDNRSGSVGGLAHACHLVWYVTPGFFTFPLFIHPSYLAYFGSTHGNSMGLSIVWVVLHSHPYLLTYVLARHPYPDTRPYLLTYWLTVHAWTRAHICLHSFSPPGPRPGMSPVHVPMICSYCGDNFTDWQRFYIGKFYWLMEGFLVIDDDFTLGIFIDWWRFYIKWYDFTISSWMGKQFCQWRIFIWEFLFKNSLLMAVRWIMIMQCVYAWHMTTRAVSDCLVVYSMDDAFCALRLLGSPNNALYLL